MSDDRTTVQWYATRDPFLAFLLISAWSGAYLLSPKGGFGIKERIGISFVNIEGYYISSSREDFASLSFRSKSKRVIYSHTFSYSNYINFINIYTIDRSRLLIKHFSFFRSDNDTRAHTRYQR